MDVEWLQLTLAFLGGGFLTTLLQNHREDRHRHADRKIDAATDAIAAFYDVHQHARSPSALGELYEAAEQFTNAVSRMTILFGRPVEVEATRIAGQVRDMLDAAKNGSERPDLGQVEALSDFLSAVRHEIGIDRQPKVRRFVTRYWPKTSR